MTAQTRSVNRGRFEQGDKPQGSDHSDLIDSFLSLADTTAQAITSDITVPTLTATTEVSAQRVNASAATITAHLTADRIFASAANIGGGTAMVVQRVTIGQATTAGASASMTLPSGVDIVDIHVDVEIPFGTGAGVTAAAVHVSASGMAAAMAIIRVSASTVPYGLYSGHADTFTASQLRNFTPGTINAYVSIVGSNTAMTAGQAMLSVIYVPN